MTTYSIYAKPNDKTAADAIFVSDGFSWGAFVFTWAWALWHRMWIVAVILISMLLITSLLPPAAQILSFLAVSILMGLHANDLLGWSLARRGYSEIALGNGNSLEEAELSFYAGGVSLPSQPVDHDTLGLFAAKS
jgi:hypothetical protein